jgi:hypothetical protein
MFIQKAEIVEGKIKYNKLGKVKANELEPGIADKTYTHEQIVASSLWHVNHRLGKKPAVTIADSTGGQCHGRVIIIDDNNIDIEFKYPFCGIATCN